ncbi:hypothetical protein YC2023_060972 [Brassica napus]
MDTRPDESQPSPLEPERRHDGSPSTVKTNPKQIVQPKQPTRCSSREVKTGGSTLEDATTQPSGREETVGDSDSCNLSEAMNRRSREIGKTPRERETARSKLKNLPPSRNKKPAKTILIEPPLSRVKAGRPLIEHVRRWRQNRSDDTEAEEEAQTVGKRTGDKKVSSIVFICERCSEGTERRERENFHRFVFTNRNIYLAHETLEEARHDYLILDLCSLFTPCSWLARKLSIWYC